MNPTLPKKPPSAKLSDRMILTKYGLGYFRGWSAVKYKGELPTRAKNLVKAFKQA